SSTVILLCDNKAKDNSLTAQGLDSSFTNYNFQFSGPALCPGSSGGGGGGLSGGSIFLIIFFVVLFIYFIGGIIFRKITTDAAGSELIPNKEFWFSLPGLIKVFRE
uniref:uncharacterized protein LOC120330901 n=1 Tax=Styela clava TaxID=7725 RepID=UPI00193AB804